MDSEPLLSPADSSTPAGHRGSTEVGGQSEWDEMFHKQTSQNMKGIKPDIKCSERGLILLHVTSFLYCK